MKIYELYNHLKNVKKVKCVLHEEVIIRIQLSNDKSLSISNPLGIEEYETAIIKDNQPFYDSKLGYDFYDFKRFNTYEEIYDEIQRILECMKSDEEEDEGEDIIVLTKDKLQ